MAGHAHPSARVMRFGRSYRAERCSTSGQRGIALLLVLWVLSLLTIIAVGLTATQRTESALVANQLATARFHAAAEAAISWAMLNLLTPPTAFEEGTDTWVPDDTPRLWSFAGESLEIRVSNEESRIDLNKATQGLLLALLVAVGLEQDTASAIADAILDWRDADDLTGLNGAEDSDYADAGRSYGAKDGPFDSVEELQEVLGVDPGLYRALAPALTVDSDNATPDQEFAPPLVQAALQGVTLEQVQLRQEGEDSGDLESGPVGRGGPLYRIRVTSLRGGEPGLSMEALVLAGAGNANRGVSNGTATAQVRARAGNTQPYKVLWRRFGLAASEPVAVAGD
jgi:general secretion pathway protein K